MSQCNFTYVSVIADPGYEIISDNLTYTEAIEKCRDDSKRLAVASASSNFNISQLKGM